MRLSFLYAFPVLRFSLSEKLRLTEQAVEDYRMQIDNRKPESYGFASMAAVPYAHIVARMLLRKRAKGTVIQLAPNPKDIVSERMTYCLSSIDGIIDLG